MTDEELLAHLPEIAAVASQVEERLNAWVGTARQRRISWARIGAALGMTRQSAWERFKSPPTAAPRRLRHLRVRPRASISFALTWWLPPRCCGIDAVRNGPQVHTAVPQ